MTPIFLNPSSSNSSSSSPSSSFCHDLERHNYQDLKLFVSPYNVEEGRSSSSLAPSPTYSFDSRIVIDQDHEHHDDRKAAKIDFSKSRRNKLVSRNYEDTTSQEENHQDQKSVIFGKSVNNNNIMNSNDGSVKYWMSSKMRLIQKMSNLPDQPDSPATTTFSTGTTSNASTHIINNSDHHQVQPAQKSEHGKLALHSPNKDKAQLTFNSFNTASGAVIRACSDCHTTTTPLWRSGPRGPKSLCNACGIRQRKARRAMAEAAATATADTTAPISAATTLPIKTSHNYYKTHNNHNMTIKEKKSRGNHYKGKFKLKLVHTATGTANSSSSGSKRERINSNNNKLCFGDFASFGLNDNNCSAFQGVFPRDVAEAAILLMELSCHGFVHS